MEDQQVDLVDTEFAGALVEGVQGGVVAVVGDPDLGFEEDLGTVDAGAADGVTDLAFVAVSGRGVDVAVSGGQRRLDRRDGLLGGCLEDAEPQRGIGTPLLKVSCGMVMLFLSCSVWFGEPRCPR